MNKKISVENLLKLLPPFILQDKVYKALAVAVAKEIYRIYQESEKMIIYANIENLEGKLLNILAEDLNIAWYDPNYPTDIKKRVIKNGPKIQRKLGTKYAVEKALGDVFPGTKIVEWFEYGGDAFTFKIVIDVTESGITLGRQDKVLEKVRFYKNARSELDIISYKVKKKANVFIGAINSLGRTIEVYPYLARDINSSGKVSLSGAVNYANTLTIYPN